MIQVSDLIGKFKHALDNDWGYIWGTAGVKWTQAKQDAATREQTVKYGQKWVGHYVADCSGLFSWAFKQLGGYMYHGSNTMFLKYTTASGTLSAGKRTDGQELKEGTAVFVWKEAEKKYTHVGLYIGGGYVIEAASTQSGVIKSKASNKKWTHWGELKDVNYEGGDEPVPKGYAIVTGTRVALRSAPTTQAGVILRVDTGKQVKLEEPPPCEWDYVSYNGKTGWMMKKFLKEGDAK
jgi:hypothetical protein